MPHRGTRQAAIFWRWALGAALGWIAACGDDGPAEPVPTCDETGTCTCDDPEICEGIDECLSGIATCDANAACVERDDGYSCRCNSDYQGDGRRCVAYGTCERDPGVCHQNGVCVGLTGEKQCRCAPGFAGTGLDCFDIDECQNRFPPCALGTCVNEPGGYRCDCPSGYTPGAEPHSCVDVDECAGDPQICGVGTCLNDIGGYGCACPVGYRSGTDGRSCENIDECVAAAAACPAGTRCVDGVGTFSCQCPAGTTGDGELCTVLVDCVATPSACDSNASCRPTLAGATCLCNEGWAGDGASCHPAGWSNISAGTDLTCGIGEDRSLWCWGTGLYQFFDRSIPDGAFERPVPGMRFRFVAVGTNHFCAVGEDRSLWCGGNAQNGRLGVMGSDDTLPLTRVGTDLDWDRVAVSSSGQEGFTCAIKVGGTLHCFGDNSHGQLGDGTTMGGMTPVQVGNETTWVAITALNQGACARKRDGSVFCWGATNAEGSRPTRLGTRYFRSFDGVVDSYLGVTSDGALVDHRNPVGEDLDWRDATHGLFHRCARKTDGSLYCWGESDRGQAAVYEAFVSQPRRVTQIATFKQATVSNFHTCGVSEDGRGYCWGSSFAAMGQGNGHRSEIPVRVGSDSNWQSVSMSETRACGSRLDGSLWCWGENIGPLIDLQLVEPSFQSPVLVPGTTGFSAITLGGYHACGLRGAAESACWGGGQYGQLGLNDLQSYRSPTDLVGEGIWSSLSAADQSTCGLRGGALLCFGNNQSGELGLPPTGMEPRPVPSIPGTDFTSIALGQGHSCAVHGGTVTCWGENSNGALGVGDTNPRTGPADALGANFLHVDVGSDQTCAIKTDGSLWCWGGNFSGEVGAGMFRQDSPIQVGMDVDWQSVSAGAQHTCGIRGAAALLYCWGSGPLGIAGVPSAPTPTAVDLVGGYRQVSTGDWASCAVKLDGTLWCWGANVYGVLGNGRSWSALPLEVGLPPI